jgi:hypothetical protein
MRTRTVAMRKVRSERLETLNFHVLIHALLEIECVGVGGCLLIAVGSKFHGKEYLEDMNQKLVRSDLESF